MISPPVELLVPFFIAGLALNLTPGSDMTFVALCAARGGPKAGLAASGGIFAGCLGHILFAVVGISAVIAASQTAFTIVKWLGVAYLLYIAIQLLREDETSADNASRGVSFGPIYAFRKAAIVNLLNPKVGIFFIAFLPQFIDPASPYSWAQILILGLLFNTTGLVVNGIVAVVSATAAEKLSRQRRVQRIARWAAATIIGALAAKLALSRNE